VHIHQDYHGDLHSGNVIVRRKGLGFDIKLPIYINGGIFKPFRGNIYSPKSETTVSLTPDTDSGTVTYEGNNTAGPLTMKDWTYYHLTFNDQNATKATFQSANNLTVGGNATVTSGTLDISIGTDTLSVAGNLLVNGANGVLTATSGDIDVEGDVNVSNGTLTAPTAADDLSFLVAGNWSVSGGVFTPGTGRVVFDAGDTGNTITTSGGTDNFYDIKFKNAAGGWQLQDALEVDQDFLVDNSETAGAGVDLNGQTVTIARDFTMAAGEVTAGASTITVARHWDSSAGTFNIDTSTVDLTGTGNLTAPAVYGTADFYDLTVAADTKVTTLLNNVTVSNIFTVGTGTLTDGASWYRVFLDKASGTPFVHGGATLDIGRIDYEPASGSGTVNVTAGDYGTGGVVMLGQDDVTFNQAGNITAGGQYYLIAVSSSTGTVINTQNYSITADELTMGWNTLTGQTTLNLGSSVVDIGVTGIDMENNGGNNHTINLQTATVTIEGPVELIDGTGQITLDEGTNSTVTLDGTNQTITGDAMFYNLTKTIGSAASYTLTLADAYQYTITNNLTLTGFNGSNLLDVASSHTSNTVDLDFTGGGAQNVSYVSATRIDSAGGVEIQAINASVNGGGNVNWNFNLGEAI